MTLARWRRRWDLNPRGAEAPNGFRDHPGTGLPNSSGSDPTTRKSRVATLARYNPGVPDALLVNLIILLVVLLGPLLFHRIEDNLEAFLFVMGVLSALASGALTMRLVTEALSHPIPITSCLGWRPASSLRSSQPWCSSSWSPPCGSRAPTRSAWQWWRASPSGWAPPSPPSVNPSAQSLRPDSERTFGSWRCLLAPMIVPGVIVLGASARLLVAQTGPTGERRAEGPTEGSRAVIGRAVRIYIFVLALVFLAEGFRPLVDRYVIGLDPRVLYWVNTISAVLDNATLTAAEIDPRMTQEQVRAILMGLLLSGGMLIPGNVPNIIAAGKLRIGSREWARVAIPIGVVLLVVYYIVLFVL